MFDAEKYYKELEKRLLKRMDEYESRLSLFEKDIRNELDLLKESREHLRRKEDEIHSIVHDMQATILSIEHRLFGYKNTVLVILRTTIYVTTFFSALGAGIWAVVTEIYHSSK